MLMQTRYLSYISTDENLKKANENPYGRLSEHNGK